MNKKYKIGTLGGLEIYFQRNVVIGALLLFGIFSVSAKLLLDYELNQSIIAGVVAMVVHFVSEFFHQQGHHAAAMKTGYPMSGILFIWVLAASLYPKDEPELSAEIHIKRAIGGPIRSFMVSILFAILALVILPTKGMIFDLFVFISGINLVIFCLGALLPLGFTDGSTLLKWWPKRNK